MCCICKYVSNKVKLSGVGEPRTNAMPFDISLKTSRFKRSNKTGNVRLLESGGDPDIPGV